MVPFATEGDGSMLKICSQSIGRARKKRVCVGRAYGAAAIPIKVVGSAASEFRWIGTGIEIAA